MSLVNGIERNLDRLQELHIIFFRQGLGSHVQQFCISRQDICLHLINGCLVQRRVQVVRSALMLTEIGDDIHLILHQGYQRGNDNGRTLHQERRQLVAQGFSTTRWHQHEGVITIQHILDDPFLITFELVKSKVFLKGFCQISLLAHILFSYLGFILMQVRLVQLLADIVSCDFKFLDFL